MANTILQDLVWLVAAASTLHSSECQRQSRARTLSLPPPHTVEQPRSATLLDQSELRDSTTEQWQTPSYRTWLVAAASTLHSSECQRQRRARTLSLPPPRTVEQPQPCSISRSLVAAPPNNGKHFLHQVAGRSGKHSPLKCQRHRRARTLSLPSPRTVEQPQPCSISRSFVAAPPNNGKHLL